MSNEVQLSEGAKWLIKRIPNKNFEAFQAELVAVFEKYGYDEELRLAYNEDKPLVVRR
ncbi:hypothetical protein HOS54_gp106 [Klebsiella phage Menlow]|uniref:Uncharacterized protein n=1 Tax=Klebsiella phage Menlow TaxID=2054273 RepID=A0A2H5BNC6_9CAUD|nr:hypothetical protein HOS54_gp106 [Klebsiella phage Menlow]AUG87843.1 hypothetical protein CPT_Menlow_142 [Klebsiella phage Menlow]